MQNILVIHGSHIMHLESHTQSHSQWEKWAKFRDYVT